MPIQLQNNYICMDVNEYYFIHKLGLPTCIINFEGEILDANDAMIKDSKAENLLDFIKCNIKEYCEDKLKHKGMVKFLLDGGEINNVENLINFKDGSPSEIRITTVKILSIERKLLIVQNFGKFNRDNIFKDKLKIIVGEIKKLQPYLNKEGKNQLNNLIYSISDTTNSKNHNEILKIVSNSFPELTSKEALISSYVYLGLNNKEISYMTSLSANNIRVICHRVMLKLNISDRKDFFKMLKSIDIK